jgi:hypothetical protein
MKTITILTCDRQPSYLADTVATIPEWYAIQYVAQTSPGIKVDCPRVRGKWEVKTEKGVVPMKDEVINTNKLYIEDETRHRDSQYNYAIALLNTKDGLIIEDDVKLCRNFDIELEQRLAEIPTKRYAFALYSCYNWGGYSDYDKIAKYPIDMFYGTQAMVFDLQTAKEFGTYLLNNIGKEPYDLALKTYIKEVDPEVVLYASKLSLVQHIGDVSTGLGSGHKTGHFIDEI